MAEKASGTPTKEFFVGMLTRDIELNDAILDLLDNCLDGVVRQKRGIDRNSTPDYYKGFYSHITISQESFIIEDNCGGIPRDVAEKYAFRMGRSSEKNDDDLPTVGIYGIGMKRAIFKIGRSAIVSTRNNGSLYQVRIPMEWATSEEWDFPISELESPSLLKNGGTRIEISDINQSISQRWDTRDKLSYFISALIKNIQQSYSFIINKGFEITINEEVIKPLPLEILFDNTTASSAIQPFLYKQAFGDVNVSLAVGFYAPPPSPDEIDDENAMKRSSADAGWTIVCNDRVVLYNDKSHLTGWGEAGVPQYHTQFIGIRGIVIFESNTPQNLPMTTTKRGIDTSSSIYAAVKDRMRQGLKMFTDYTNRWKGRNEQEREFSKLAKSVSINSLLRPEKASDTPSAVNYRANKGGQIFKPTLPTPPNDTPYRRISYSKSIEDISDIVEFLYHDRAHEITPSQVGEKCFDRVLEEAHKSKKGE